MIVDICSVKAISENALPEEQCDDGNGIGWPVHIVNQEAFARLQKGNSNFTGLNFGYED